MRSLESVLKRLGDGAPPAQAELRMLLACRGAELEALCRAAAAVRDAHFGRRAALYGFIYLSTHCRNDCAFCFYRRTNSELARYRKSPEEVLAVAQGLAREGVRVLDLTLGEDSQWLSAAGFDDLCGVVRQLKQSTDCAVMVSPGVLDQARLEALARAGADWYACYQETHDEELFAHLRLDQDFHVRHTARTTAARLGMHVEDGLLVGAGASVESLARSVWALRDFSRPAAAASAHAVRLPALSQVRAMRYVPHPRTIPTVGTLSGQSGDGGDESAQELALMAVLRLTMPRAFIPASLDVDGLDGLQSRMDAGANVVTSIVPAGAGLAGVASEHLDIDNHRRSVPAVMKALEGIGFTSATEADYSRWLGHARNFVL